MTRVPGVAELARLVHDGLLDHRRSGPPDALPGRHGAGAARRGPWPSSAASSTDRRRGVSADDADHPPAAGGAREDPVERRLERVEGDLGHALAEAVRAEIGRRAGPRAPAAPRSGSPTESIPSSATPRRMNGRTVVLERRPAGVAGRRDGRARPERPQDVRQRRAADRVDGARPAGRLERPRALGGDLVARHDPGRAERPQPRLLVGLAGRRPDLVAARRRGSRPRCSPTPPLAPVTSTGPSPGAEPALLQRGDGHRGREPGRPDRHRLAGVEARPAAARRSRPGSRVYSP